MIILLFQVFLQNTANIFQSGPRITLPLSNHLSLREMDNDKNVASSSDDLSSKQTDDSLEQETVTPTNQRSQASSTATEEDADVPSTPKVSDAVTNGTAACIESLEAPSWSRLNSKELHEESLDGDSAAASSSSISEDSEEDENGSSCGSPVEARNHYVALPSVVVVEEEYVNEVVSVPNEAINSFVNLSDVATANGDAKEGDSVANPQQEETIETKQSTVSALELPIAVQPQLATQEDFDLSPSSEMHPKQPTVSVSATSDDKQPSPTAMARTRSCQSVESATITDTDCLSSDWAAADELNLDSPEQSGKPALPTTEPPLSDDEQLVVSLPKSGSSAPRGDDDFDFADESEALSLAAPNLRGYSKLVDEQDPDEDEDIQKKTPDKFVRLRDSIAVVLDKKPTTNTQREERARDVERRVVLDKKTEPSPGLLRKKEALSQERERQSDVVKDMVMSLIRQQRASPDKAASNRRSGSYGSYGSLLSSSFSSPTPPPPVSSSSRRNSVRSGSEPPIVAVTTRTTTPDGPENQRDYYATPQTSLKPVTEVKSSEEYYTPVSAAHGIFDPKC